MAHEEQNTMGEIVSPFRSEELRKQMEKSLRRMGYLSEGEECPPCGYELRNREAFRSLINPDEDKRLVVATLFFLWLAREAYQYQGGFDTLSFTKKVRDYLSTYDLPTATDRGKKSLSEGLGKRKAEELMNGVREIFTEEDLKRVEDFITLHRIKVQNILLEEILLYLSDYLLEGSDGYIGEYTQSKGYSPKRKKLNKEDKEAILSTAAVIFFHIEHIILSGAFLEGGEENIFPLSSETTEGGYCESFAEEVWHYFIPTIMRALDIYSYTLLQGYTEEAIEKINTEADTQESKIQASEKEYISRLSRKATAERVMGSKFKEYAEGW